MEEEGEGGWGGLGQRGDLESHNSVNCVWEVFSGGSLLRLWATASAPVDVSFVRIAT